jgi:hypothetical protein
MFFPLLNQIKSRTQFKTQFFVSYMVQFRRLPPAPTQLVDAVEVFLAGNVRAPNVAHPLGWLRLLFVRVSRRLGVAGSSAACVGRDIEGIVEHLARVVALLLPDASEVHLVLQEEVALLSAHAAQMGGANFQPEPPEFTPSPTPAGTPAKDTSRASPLPRQPSPPSFRQEPSPPGMTAEQLEAVLARFATSMSPQPQPQPQSWSPQLEAMLERLAAASLAMNEARQASPASALTPDVAEALRKSAERGTLTFDSWSGSGSALDHGLMQEESAWLPHLPRYIIKRNDPDFALLLKSIQKTIRFVRGSETKTLNLMIDEASLDLRLSGAHLPLAEASMAEYLMSTGKEGKAMSYPTLAMIAECLVLSPAQRNVVRRARLGRCGIMDESTLFRGVIIDVGQERHVSHQPWYERGHGARGRGRGAPAQQPSTPQPITPQPITPQGGGIQK